MLNNKEYETKFDDFYNKQIANNKILESIICNYKDARLKFYFTLSVLVVILVILLVLTIKFPSKFLLLLVSGVLLVSKIYPLYCQNRNTYRKYLMEIKTQIKQDFFKIFDGFSTGSFNNDLYVENSFGSLEIYGKGNDTITVEGRVVSEYSKDNTDDVEDKEKIDKILDNLKGQNKNFSFLSELKILSNLSSSIDDWIFGEYQDLQVRIIEVNSSKFRVSKSRAKSMLIAPIATLAVCLLGLGTYMFGTYLLDIGADFTNELFFHLIIISICIICFLLLLYISLKIIIKYISQILLGINFRGIVTELVMNKKFKGEIFIVENNNSADKLILNLGKYEKVELEDPIFSKLYSVYATSQIEARYILTTAFLQRYLDLKEKYNAKYVRAEFCENKVFIAIHTGRDMFELPTYERIPSKSDFVPLYNEICSTLDVAKVLKLTQNLGL